MNTPRIELPISEMPRQWYNFAVDLKNYPLPPEVMERSIKVMEGLPKPE